VFCPHTKNNFTNVIIVGALVGLCPRGLHTDIKSMKRSRSPWKTIQNGLLCTVLCKLHHILTLSKGFHGDQGFFLSLNCPKCNKKQFKGQKSHYLLEKPLKMVNYEQYLLWRPYVKIYEKRYKKSASSYHTQTGYISQLDCLS